MASTSSPPIQDSVTTASQNEPGSFGMPARKSAVSAAAEAKYGKNFDPWHSAANGHQRSEARLPVATGWRQSRSMRLSHQFKSEGTAEAKKFDEVGRGPENWHLKSKVQIPVDIEARAQRNGMDMLNGKGKALPAEGENSITEEKREYFEEDKENHRRQRGIFDGLVIYINGSTYPLISDHKLKQVLVDNGAKLSLHLGRRQVTHVILGKPCGTRGAGAGGGLAGSKLDKEIKRVKIGGVKYVGVEWVLESLKAGKRQAEGPYANLKIAAMGQRSVYSMFKKPKDPSPAAAG